MRRRPTCARAWSNWAWTRSHGVGASRHAARRGERRGAHGGRRPAIALRARRGGPGAAQERRAPQASHRRSRPGRALSRPTRRATPPAPRTITASTTRTGRELGYDAERGQTFSQADEEYADLACFLQVCRETGIEPLVVILPVHGAWYDREDVSATSGRRTTSACAASPTRRARLRDFSTCEYEKYFLCDTVHPGGAAGCASSRRSTTSCTIATTPSSAAARSARPSGLDAAGNAGASLAGAGEAAS
ncbi:MAG: D-alanyl-lipoteichoic acid biosynthesis protein DltD [Gordonibacter urolithinfaciens]